MMTGNWKRVTTLDGVFRDVNFDNVCEMYEVPAQLTGFPATPAFTNILYVSGNSIRVKQTIEQIRMADELGVLSR